MKEEIVAGLKNAIERGQPLEQAAQSFKNAGYNPNEVDEAKRYLSGGVTQMLPQPPSRSGMAQPLAQQNQGNINSQQTGSSQARFPQTNNQSMQGNFNPQYNTPSAPPGNLQSNRLPSSKSESSGGGGKTALIVIVISLLLIFIGALGYLVYYLAT